MSALSWFVLAWGVLISGEATRRWVRIVTADALDGWVATTATALFMGTLGVCIWLFASTLQ